MWDLVVIWIDLVVNQSVSSADYLGWETHNWVTGALLGNWGILCVCLGAGCDEPGCVFS
jgi:hypothetical protein